MPFDATLPYRVHPQVAIRPEPFGAIAYHYGNRRLLFLKSERLVQVLDCLESHRSAEEAVAAVTTAPKMAAALIKALGDLESSGVVDAR